MRAREPLTPTQNLILRMLPAEDFQKVLPRSTWGS